MLSKAIGHLLISIALKIWRTDLSFSDYRYGPPDHGLKYGFAWCAYHTGRAALEKVTR